MITTQNTRISIGYIFISWIDVTVYIVAVYVTLNKVLCWFQLFVVFTSDSSLEERFLNCPIVKCFTKSIIFLHFCLLCCILIVSQYYLFFQHKKKEAYAIHFLNVKCRRKSYRRVQLSFTNIIRKSSVDPLWVLTMSGLWNSINKSN